MKPISFLILLCASIAHAAETKPNILFIAIDDLRPELGCYGSPLAKTPHIDKLASAGTVFTRAYCQVPVCGASRASLMTGILPTRDRFVNFNTKADTDVPGAMTLPEVFKNAGYTTLSHGKIFHHKADTQDRSWSLPAWRPVDKMYGHDPETKQHISKTKKRGRFFESPDVPDSAYADGQIAAKTIEELRRLKQAGKPFFIACGFMKPHLPFYAPKKYWDLYDRGQIDIADNRHRPKDAPTELNGSNEFRSYHLASYEENSDEFHRMMRHGYLACTSYVDKLTGDILTELENLGLTQNTIVVLWGDHGWHLGEHNFWGKHNTMHLSTRVPLIVKVPGRKLARLNPPWKHQTSSPPFVPSPDSPRLKPSKVVISQYCLKNLTNLSAKWHTADISAAMPSSLQFSATPATKMANPGCYTIYGKTRTKMSTWPTIRNTAMPFIECQPC